MTAGQTKKKIGTASLEVPRERVTTKSCWGKRENCPAEKPKKDKDSSSIP